jgi:MerR family transcriptional regulator/heat shock protein HspR
MEPSLISREEVAERLAVPSRLLLCYEARGLVRSVRQGNVEGYPPSEVRRIWTVLSCQLDLGINLAGVEAILKLRDQLAEVHRRLGEVSHELQDALDSAGAYDDRNG